jgi:hypothetical protein
MGAFRAPASGRGAGYRVGGGLLLLVVLSAAVLIGSVHAAPSTKNYTANVHVTDATAAANALNTFTVTLKNDPRSNQTFGSANIKPPAGFDATAASTGRQGWSANVDSAGIVELRSTSNAVVKGDSVAVSVTIDPASMTGCGSATWDTAIKQSNDFNGTNNEFTRLAAGTDLTPLGSFVVAPIESVLAGDIHVPQILVGHGAPISIAALDTCGNPDANYAGPATLAPKVDTPPRLVNATFSGLSWATNNAGDRIGSATLTPADVEVQDNIVVSDTASKIFASAANTFDVVEKICAGSGSTCTWTNKKGNITATSTVVGADSTNDTASLGLGFRSLNATCTIAGKVTGSFGDGIQIVPVNYGGNYVVTLTYAKSVSGNGPASGFNVCKSTDNGLSWAPIPQCGKVPAAPCADPQRTSSGALQITLYLKPLDPFSGGFG